MPDIQRYLDGIESQHQSKPRYMAMVTALLEKIDDVTAVIRQMPRLFYVGEAEGRQLDAAGRLAGTNREYASTTVPDAPELLDDDVFRKVIKAQIAQNQWDGTNAGFREIWEMTIGDMLDAAVHDNQDMSMNVRVNGSLEPVLTELILAGRFVPKPMGVGMNYMLSESVRAIGGEDIAMRVGSKVYGNTAIISIPKGED